MDSPNNSDPELKQANVKLTKVNSALKKENAKLQDKIVKLEVEKISDKNKIKALEKFQPQVNVNIHGFDDPEEGSGK